MNPAEIHQLFERCGVLQTGHFRLSTGRHSDTYVQCARVLEQPRFASSLGEALAARFHDQVDVVVSPALGGILIGYAVGHALGCRFAFTERVEGAMTLRRGQRVAPGERAVVIEDVVTTGGSAAEVAALLEAAGATVVGVGALVDRSERPPPFLLEALLRVEAPTWDGGSCPLCAAGEALHTPGSRSLSSP